MARRHPFCPAGARLIAWLEENKLTRRAFAERIGVAWPALWRWIVGSREPRLEAAFRIEDATGIEARAWIRTGSGAEQSR